METEGKVEPIDTSNQRNLDESRYEPVESSPKCRFSRVLSM